MVSLCIQSQITFYEFSDWISRKICSILLWQLVYFHYSDSIGSHPSELYKSQVYKILVIGIVIWMFFHHKYHYFKGTLSGLRQFLSTESPLKMMKNGFYFALKAFFVLKIFEFLSWLFCHIEKKASLKR